MATVQAQGGGAVTASSTNNRGGTFVGGGSATSSSTALNMDRAHLGKRDNGVFGNQITAAQGSKALSGGVLGSMVAGKYVIMRNCTELATVAKTNLQSGGSRPENRRSINYSETARAAFVSAYTITAGDGQTVSYTVVDTNTTFENDQAARPSRSVPGEFVYRTGAPVPVQADYPARTNG